MSEEKKDILFQIDMQLYNEFNNTIATMNDHLGDIYSLKDIEEVKQAEKEKEIELLRNAIMKQQKEIEQLANGIRVLGTNPDITTEEIIKEFTEKPISEEYMKKFNSSYISKDKVLKALGYEENGEEYKRIYNKEELILSLIRTINEECDRLEDIEDQKTMLEIHNIENMRDKYWQDKIKDILKKYEKRPLEEGICFYKEIENLLEEQL